jgi:PqqD family protein of HPr-rel-A system
MSAEIRWSADVNLRQHWRCWDDEVMVFHAGSGDTHCLNTLAAHVLEMLMEHAMTATELKKVLQAGSEGAPGAQEIEALLRQFDDLGLISPGT